LFRDSLAIILQITVVHVCDRTPQLHFVPSMNNEMNQTIDSSPEKREKFISVGIGAHGTIAIGISAHGVIAMGVISHGIISVGVIAMGVVSMGLVSMGLLTTGLVTMGIKAYGPQAMELMQPHNHGMDNEMGDDMGSESMPFAEPERIDEAEEEIIPEEPNHSDHDGM